MPYLLGKIKRTVSSQKVADVADLDGALVLTPEVSQDAKTLTLRGVDANGDTYDLEFVIPDPEEQLPLHRDGVSLFASGG